MTYKVLNLTAGGIAAEVRETLSGPEEEPALRSAESGGYRNCVRPELVEKLASIRSDKTYIRAERDHLFYLDDNGRERKVLDLVGGYGANLFGHNHPDFVTEAILCLSRKAPFSAQGSIRQKAGELAEKLSSKVGSYTGREYLSVFANSGTEVVEAAVKHALMERETAVASVVKAMKESHFRILREVRDSGGEEIRKALLGRLSSPPPDPGADLDTLLDALVAENERILSTPPVFMALKGGFHGKTLASLRLTHNPSFREPFGTLGLQTIFLSGTQAELDAAILENNLWYDEVEFGLATTARILRKPFSNIAGLFLEPIQGEGGIHPIPPEIVEWLRRPAAHRFPVIIDEIQSGMGRTGKFLASEHYGIVGDYYCLGKSLGGGIAKIGVLLVDRARYVEGFSLLHTSTFAEDELSSCVGLKALDLLSVEKPGVMVQVERKGTYLLGLLEKLKEAFPEIILDIRGKGLMIGVEFAPQSESPSWLIRCVHHQDYLGYLISGYMLNECGIRIFPTLSSPNTLRIEPSFLIGLDDIEYLVKCLEKVCALLKAANLGRLSGFIAGYRPLDAGPVPDFSDIRILKAAEDQRTKVAFLGHFIKPEDIKSRDASLMEIPDSLMSEYYARTNGLFRKAEMLESINVISKTGREVNLNFVGHYLTSEEIFNALKARDYGWIRDRVVESVELAKRNNCRLVGFGGYTSIVTHNCLNVPVSNVAMTTGNSLTVAMAIEAIYRMADTTGIELGTSRLGVVGASGNIGSIYSQIIAEKVGRISLFGSAKSEKRLKRLALKILAQAASRIQSTAEGNLQGLALSLSNDPLLRESCLAYDFDKEVKTDYFDDLCARLRLERYLSISTDLAGLRDCRLIVSASNDSEPLIFPSHLGDEPQIICDIAVPRDTSPSIEVEAPHARIIQGGLVKLPLNPEFRIGGIPLATGQSFACMAETILLGLEGIERSYSVGEIRKEQVQSIMDAAAKHGFQLAAEKVARSF